MKPIFWILGGVGAWMLFSKKSENQSSSVTTLPEVVIKPTTVKKKPVVESNDIPLSTKELDILNTGSNDDLFASGMISNNYTFVDHAAEQLAENGDTRAIELTSRLADWKKSS